MVVDIVSTACTSAWSELWVKRRVNSRTNVRGLGIGSARFSRQVNCNFDVYQCTAVLDVYKFKLPVSSMKKSSW